MAYYTTASGGGAAAHFEHQDWLGTERMRTTYNGGVEGTYTSLPWGDAQTTTYGSDTDAAHYATLDYDSETNTDHAQFRQYNPTQGRFMSPDPYGGSYDTLNPQSMNRYVYAMNNPLGNIDPSGYDTAEDGWLAEGDTTCEIDGRYAPCYMIANSISGGGGPEGGGAMAQCPNNSCSALYFGGQWITPMFTSDGWQYYSFRTGELNQVGYLNVFTINPDYVYTAIPGVDAMGTWGRVRLPQSMLMSPTWAFQLAASSSPNLGGSAASSGPVNNNSGHISVLDPNYDGNICRSSWSQLGVGVVGTGIMAGAALAAYFYGPEAFEGVEGLMDAMHLAPAAVPGPILLAYGSAGVIKHCR